MLMAVVRFELYSAGPGAASGFGDFEGEYPSVRSAIRRARAIADDHFHIVSVADSVRQLVAVGRATYARQGRRLRFARVRAL